MNNTIYKIFFYLIYLHLLHHIYYIYITQILQMVDSLNSAALARVFNQSLCIYVIHACAERERAKLLPPPFLRNRLPWSHPGDIIPQ